MGNFRFPSGSLELLPDALLGISFTGFFGVGIILLVATPSTVHFMHILFGNLQGIETSVLILTVIVGALTLLAVMIVRKDLILFCFTPLWPASSDFHRPGLS